MQLEHGYTCMEGGYLKQLMETVYRLTKRVEVRVSKGMKQRYNQNNDVGVVWQTNNFIYVLGHSGSQDAK